ncbi:hypothetical protein C2E23DRAFT_899992, partial [Lenzites betulinus]
MRSAGGFGFELVARTYPGKHSLKHGRECNKPRGDAKPRIFGQYGIYVRARAKSAACLTGPLLQACKRTGRAARPGKLQRCVMALSLSSRRLRCRAHLQARPGSVRARWRERSPFVGAALKMEKPRAIVVSMLYASTRRAPPRVYRPGIQPIFVCFPDKSLITNAQDATANPYVRLRACVQFVASQSPF